MESGAAYHRVSRRSIRFDLWIPAAAVDLPALRAGGSSLDGTIGWYNPDEVTPQHCISTERDEPT